MEKKYNQIVDLINKDKSISILVLGEAPDGMGSNDLINKFTAGLTRSINIPLTIVPGNLSIEDLEKNNLIKKDKIMFIQTEVTPNPKTVKFIPGEDVAVDKSISLSKSDNLNVSPLAKRLFLIEGVSNIFLGKDFISITKDDSVDWQVLKPLILSQIMQHYMSNEKVVEAVSE